MAKKRKQIRTSLRIGFTKPTQEGVAGIVSGIDSAITDDAGNVVKQEHLDRKIDLWLDGKTTAQAVWFVAMAVRHNRARGEQIGRPKGIRRRRHNDSAALALMAQIERETGITKKETLAREALERSPGIAGGASTISIVKRLAAGYKAQK